MEPIFVPVSLIFWLWDDVRALLVLQAAALAAGAWPIYLLARRRLLTYASPYAAEWGGLVLGCAYLLAPALQAATVSEFHAMPFAAPLVAWSLWAVERRQWGGFVASALLVMMTQEGLALLGALLGVYAVVRSIITAPADDAPLALGPGSLARAFSQAFLSIERSETLGDVHLAPGAELPPNAEPLAQDAIYRPLPHWPPHRPDLRLDRLGEQTALQAWSLTPARLA